jgi:transposase
MLMEQLDYNLLFRWFVGLNMDDAIWDVTVFRHASGICSRTSTSPWTERSWKRGRV